MRRTKLHMSHLQREGKTYSVNDLYRKMSKFNLLSNASSTGWSRGCCLQGEAGGSLAIHSSRWSLSHSCPCCFGGEKKNKTHRNDRNQHPHPVVANKSIADITESAPTSWQFTITRSQPCGWKTSYWTCIEIWNSKPFSEHRSNYLRGTNEFSLASFKKIPKMII